MRHLTISFIPYQIYTSLTYNPSGKRAIESSVRGGSLLASFYNPVLFVFSKDDELAEKGILEPRYELPYADTHALDQEQVETRIQHQEPLIYGHTLSSQIAGQLEAGFVLAGFYEDEHPTPRFLIEKYMNTLIATRAIKPS